VRDRQRSVIFFEMSIHIAVFPDNSAWYRVRQKEDSQVSLHLFAATPPVPSIRKTAFWAIGHKGTSRPDDNRCAFASPNRDAATRKLSFFFISSRIGLFSILAGYFREAGPRIADTVGKSFTAVIGSIFA
jgi:hypothetical protein